jgi:hypothetical protein
VNKHHFVTENQFLYHICTVFFMFWASTVGRSLEYFLKTSQVFGVTPGRYNSELCSEIRRVFCVSPMQGNTEDSIFKEKMVLPIPIPSF